MDITVILCTYNRCQSLAKALESLAAQTLPSAVEWEVLVVDNNSKDQTRTVAEDYSRRHPGRFRYLFEPQPGKSHALNAGIRDSHGDIIAFIDDDATAEPTWLQNLTSGLHGNEWAGAGGRIVPAKNISFPRWFPPDEPRLFRTLALFSCGLEPGPLTEPPLGTNMAFRKELFERYGGFRTDLGPCPGSEIRGEDTEFGGRILAAGARMRYEPAAIVLHPVSPDRLRKQYFLTWWFDKGRSEFRQFGIPRDATWFVAGVPLSLFRRLARWTLLWILSISPARRFSCRLKVWTLAGQIVESYRHGHSRETVTAS